MQYDLQNSMLNGYRSFNPGSGVYNHPGQIGANQSMNVHFNNYMQQQYELNQMQQLPGDVQHQ